MKIKNVKYNLGEDGFCFLPLVFSKQETQNSIEGLWRVINGEYRSGRKPECRFWNPGDDPHSIIKIDKPHLSDSSVWKLITNKKLGQLLARATKAKYIQVWHSQVVWKPHSKDQKGNAGWHRDAQYWPFWSKEGLYTAWIALTDVSINSGPLRFLRGSNLWKTVEGMDFFNQNIKSQEKILDKLKKHKDVVCATLRAGEVSIHSSQTYHSSMGNLENKPRVGMVVHFRTDKSKRIEVGGSNKHYLDQIEYNEIAPIIYQENREIL